jgi:ubiquinone/menaquinone biosynthesis C-methylase UbiE/uncharacterized protein YbaR (Trm112 family)
VSLRDIIPIVCPLCRGELAESALGYHCRPCRKNYPLQGGIPDFRIFPDPYLDFEEDRRRTDFVLKALDRFDLPGLLEHYWSVSDVTPEVLRGKFIRSALLGEHKAQRVLRLLHDNTFATPVRAERVLEIGSGTGNFLAAAASHFKQVVGVDIGMRWLHVSRRRFMDQGMAAPPLICCCAEHLPFPDNYFDLTVCSATFEFTRDQDQVLNEAARTLAPSGAMYLSTVNRYSIAQDPYVYLWGVSWLPRRWQAAYVRWRRNASYENIRLLSYRELKRIATAHFRGFEAALPDIDDESLKQFPFFKRFQVRVYRFVKRLPPMALFLRWFGPQWDVKFSRPYK